MGKIFLIDTTKCNGCYSCQLACKDEHVGNDWSPVAKPQPDTGHFWLRITETVRGSVPKVRVHYMPELCQHCDNAPCISACSRGAVYRRDDGLVVIDPDKCAGDRSCAAACPYGAIYYNSELNISQKCTGCAHLLDEGWTEPRCAQACHTDALLFGDEEALEDKLCDTERLRPELGASPRVYYKGLLNRFFIAGEVYDPVEDECLEGASVTLRDADGSVVATLLTDVFGDFWFERQEPGGYTVVIEMPGYTPVTVAGVNADRDVNIGSVELIKQ